MPKRSRESQRPNCFSSAGKSVASTLILKGVRKSSSPLLR